MAGARVPPEIEIVARRSRSHVGGMERIEPGPGRESVWDYPRPPRVEPVAETVKVVHGGGVLAESRRALRVLETSHPPTYYIPASDVAMQRLMCVAGKTSFCEFKGTAQYWALTDDPERIVAWSYASPSSGFEAIADHLCFCASQVDEAWVGDERAKAQASDFYGGWITSKVVGPFKGPPGTSGW